MYDRPRCLSSKNGAAQTVHFLRFHWIMAAHGVHAHQRYLSLEEGRFSSELPALRGRPVAPRPRIGKGRLGSMRMAASTAHRRSTSLGGAVSR